MLSTRIFTAVLLIAAVLAALFLLPPRWWLIACFLLIAIAALEWAHIERFSTTGRIAFALGLAAIALGLMTLAGFSIADATWPRHVIALVSGAATLFWLLVVPPWLHFRWRMPSAIVAALVGFVVLVPAWLALVQLRAQSPARLLAFMAIVWIADTAAYFTGRAIGRHKLAPEISPGKTWEGVAGGIVAVMIYAIVLLFAAPQIPGASTPGAMVAWVVFAMAVAALSVCGDLFESLQKRQAGVKDSGHTLPGHGGVLDRIDALVAALPPLALASVLFLR